MKKLKAMLVFSNNTIIIKKSSAVCHKENE